MYKRQILVIEHHTEYIADYCKHVLLMRDGGAAWKLPTREALQRVDELEACNIFPPQVTTAAERLRRAGHLPASSPLPTTVEEGKAIFSALRYRGAGKVLPEKTEAAEPAVALRNVSVSYRSVKGEDRKVFRGLNLSIRKGEKVALIGSNGAGKSTMMRLMVGLLKPEAGDVQLLGQSILRRKTEDLSRIISLVYQNPEQMFIQDLSLIHI